MKKVDSIMNLLRNPFSQPTNAYELEAERIAAEADTFQPSMPKAPKQRGRRTNRPTPTAPKPQPALSKPVGSRYSFNLEPSALRTAAMVGSAAIGAMTFYLAFQATQPKGRMPTCTRDPDPAARDQCRMSRCTNPGSADEAYFCKLESSTLSGDKLIARSYNHEHVKAYTGRSKEERIEMEQAAFERVSKNTPANVVFHRDRLGDGEVTGGLCSAMALDIAGRYLRHEVETSNIVGMHQCPAPNIHTLAHWVDEYQSGAPTHLALKQSVYNAIGLQAAPLDGSGSPIPHQDNRWAKINALAAFDGLKATRASRSISLSKQNLLQKMGKAVQAVVQDDDNGTYLMRTLRECRDKISGRFRETCDIKGERYGHSTLLIREGEKNYYFNSNYGLTEIDPSENTVDAFLAKQARMQDSLWRLDGVRLYKLELDPEVAGRPANTSPVPQPRLADPVIVHPSTGEGTSEVETLPAHDRAVTFVPSEATKFSLARNLRNDSLGDHSEGTGDGTVGVPSTEDASSLVTVQAATKVTDPRAIII